MDIDWPSDRAQNTIDLLFGISIFIAMITFIIIVNSNLFFPPGISSTDETTAADTTANELINTVLSSPDKEELNSTKVTQFFAGDITPDLTRGDNLNMNITLSQVNKSEPPPSMIPSAGETITWPSGNNPQGHATTVSRVTTVEGRYVWLNVTVWEPS